jgi:hypothetical protein
LTNERPSSEAERADDLKSGNSHPKKNPKQTVSSLGVSITKLNPKEEAKLVSVQLKMEF